MLLWHTRRTGSVGEVVEDYLTCVRTRALTHDTAGKLLMCIVSSFLLQMMRRCCSIQTALCSSWWMISSGDVAVQKPVSVSSGTAEADPVVSVQGSHLP